MYLSMLSPYLSLSVYLSINQSISTYPSIYLYLYVQTLLDACTIMGTEAVVEVHTPNELEFALSKGNILMKNRMIDWLIDWCENSWIDG